MLSSRLRVTPAVLPAETLLPWRTRAPPVNPALPAPPAVLAIPVTEMAVPVRLPSWLALVMTTLPPLMATSPERVLELSAVFQAISHKTAHHKEAVDAFIQKREPNFKD